MVFIDRRSKTGGFINLDFSDGLNLGHIWATDGLWTFKQAKKKPTVVKLSAFLEI